jgi:hypothetical protein
MSGVRGALLVATAFGATLALAACGETTMSAEDFVTSIEEEGVRLELTEDELVSDDPDKELYGLDLKPLPGGGGTRTHGSLSVYDDSDGADSGLDACRAAADLLCYQAGNIVIILEGGGIEAQQLAVAMEKLEE